MKKAPSASAIEAKCAGCGHSRADHIGIDGPCSSHHGKDFCGCDHFAPMRGPVAEA